MSYVHVTRFLMLNVCIFTTDCIYQFRMIFSTDSYYVPSSETQAFVTEVQSQQNFVYVEVTI